MKINLREIIDRQRPLVTNENEGEETFGTAENKSIRM